MKIFRGKLKFGDKDILLEIEDEDLIIFVENEYIHYRYTAGQRKGLSLSVQSSSREVSYTFRKNGEVRKRIVIPITSDTPYKEFILQGMIEMCLFEEGIFFMHASSFIEDTILHVFLGPSGSGKTTILKRLDPKKITSNDTLALMHQKRKTKVLYPSPFDRKAYAQVKGMMAIPVREIRFYALRKSEKNSIEELLLHEKMELLVQNMNTYMFAVQNDVARRTLLKKRLQEEAIKTAFFLSKCTIRRLCFNRKITKTQFNQLQQV